MEGPFEISNKYRDFSAPHFSDPENPNEAMLAETANELPEEENNNNPEKNESREVIESAQEARANLMIGILEQRWNQIKPYYERVINTPVLSKTFNHIPVLGDSKMFFGALRGQEISGEKRRLSAAERLCYLSAVFSSALAVYLVFEGDYQNALVSEGVSNTITNIDHFSTAIKTGIEVLTNKFPTAAHFVQTLSDVALSKKELLAQALAQTKNFVST